MDIYRAESPVSLEKGAGTAGFGFLFPWLMASHAGAPGPHRSSFLGRGMYHRGLNSVEQIIFHIQIHFFHHSVYTSEGVQARGDSKLALSHDKYPSGRELH